MGTLARLLSSGVLLLSAAAPSAATAPAGTAGYCPGDTGVTVVVDFTDLGGEVVVRCAPGRTGTGTDALTAAGFTFEGTQRWGTAFICRVQGRPSADEELPKKGDRDYKEQCVDTPPTEANWSYSYAENGGEWIYSTSSAKTRRAIEGGFEGWRFTLNGGSTEPSVPPLRPPSDTPEPQEPQQPQEPQPNAPDKPNRPDRPQGPGDDRPSDPPPTQPTEEPTDEPTDEPPDGASDGDSRAAGGAPSGRPGRSDKPDPKPDQPKAKPDKDKPKDKPARSNNRAVKPGQPQELGTTADGAAVTGELPAESAPDAEEDATSGTTTLLGVGLLALLGAGAAFTAYRRRSQNT